MTKKKMLFIDDRTKRIMAALRQFNAEFDVTICANVPEALRYLCAQPWDEIHLDFDLDGYDYQDPDSATCGMEIVRYIERSGWPMEKRPKFILHSSNPFGRKMMKETLERLQFEVIERRFIYQEAA